MKMLIKLIVFCMILCYSSTLFCSKFIGSVEGIDFYHVTLYKKMTELSPFLQSDLEKSIRKNLQHQKKYKSFKAGEMTLVVGLNQKLKLVVFSFQENAEDILMIS
ncbi:hypothetical protein JST56_06915 [Candidatus Dependentiae bacterium]|nr:hypothetical protein [Candidatus Dependentiae bacterium]